MGRRRSESVTVFLAPRRCGAQVVLDPICDSTRTDPVSKAVWGRKPVAESFNAATRIASSADDNQMVFFETF